ncbi:MAG TPA: hypothetical protein VMN36_03900 [Verrucomicrobiales bacterium]|nr:hypothetical protein [Verrucomicrobiales bacterium]
MQRLTRPEFNDSPQSENLPCIENALPVSRASGLTFATNMKGRLLPILVTVLWASLGMALADEGQAFEPSIGYRTIRFVEYGGGPVREYVAEKFTTSEVLFEDGATKAIFTTSQPPTTATKTVVAGLFVRRKKGSEWTFSDARRSEASGKYADAKAVTTNSERAESHISVTLFQGGRGHSYSQCVSYMVEDRILKLDPPQEKPTGEQPADGKTPEAPQPPH